MTCIFYHLKPPAIFRFYSDTLLFIIYVSKQVFKVIDSIMTLGIFLNVKKCHFRKPKPSVPQPVSFFRLLWWQVYCLTLTALAVNVEALPPVKSKPSLPLCIHVVWPSSTLVPDKRIRFHPGIHETDNGSFQIQSRANPLQKFSVKRDNGGKTDGVVWIVDMKDIMPFVNAHDQSDTHKR